MFISYSMFIFLIISTIIMIALIIYLTMTAKGPNKQQKTKNATITTEESTQTIEQAPIPTTISNENSETSYSTERLEHHSYNQTESSYTSSTSQTEHSSFEEELYVLPYPKEDKKEEETIYTTSIFKRTSQDKDEPTNHTKN